MISPKTKRTVLKIIPYTIIWWIFSFIYLFLEKGLLGDLQHYPATGNPYNFIDNAIVLISTVTVVGTLIGLSETLFLNKIFRHRSFTEKIIYKTFIYLLVIIFFLILNTVISNSINLQSNIFSATTWHNVWEFFSVFAFWSVVIYIAAIIIITLFYAEVRDNLGQEVLYNFFTGKYHRPLVEERIFMFLDMKSSTTIAEQLGHVQYFEMLKQYYEDLSEPIVDYAGEIYQYVGDEIVLSWKMKNGLYKNNFLHCFLAMKKSLVDHSIKYKKEFGVVPTFKAGFHFGEVTTGEIGSIKQDIIFTGDVLNTAARIQGLCNTYEVDLLISGELVKMIENEEEINFKSLGKVGLRGRDEKVELFTIEY